MDRDEGECIGGGLAAEPARGSVRQERDGKTGECSVCGQRFTLDHNGGIPRHQLPSN
jgi:hypothetical protein